MKIEISLSLLLCNLVFWDYSRVCNYVGVAKVSAFIFNVDFHTPGKKPSLFLYELTQFLIPCIIFCIRIKDFFIKRRRVTRWNVRYWKNLMQPTHDRSHIRQFTLWLLKELFKNIFTSLYLVNGCTAIQLNSRCRIIYVT